MRNFWFFLVILILTLSSCFETPFYSDSSVVDKSGWHSSDTLVYNFNIQDSSARFNTQIDLSHTVSYPYSNLYLFIDIKFPNEKHRVDTIECVLADKRGKWYGKGLGDMVNHRIDYLDKIAFPLNGEYEVQITHGMRRDPLEEITDLGLRLEIVSL